MKLQRHLFLLLAHALFASAAHSQSMPSLKPGVYRGWKTQCLRNGLVEVHVVPELGGRVVQLKVVDEDFFWVNPDLAGKSSPESGLAPDRVEVTASMKNIDTRPRRWGLWVHTQLDAAARGGRSPNRLMNAWCPASVEFWQNGVGEIHTYNRDTEFPDDPTKTPQRPGAKAPAPLAEADLRLEAVPGLWSKDKAWDWYEKLPWLVGCNFLPSTAVNAVEMWQADTFDVVTMDRELGWARGLGMNAVRVFLNFVVWKADPEGLKQRVAEFLKIADRHQISVMPVLLDDCNFSGRVATPGKQPDPIPGVHNSQWVSSPPLEMVTDRSAWSELERYTKDMVGAFANDRRVVVWDLYNEPGNSNMGSKSLPLARWRKRCLSGRERRSHGNP